MLVDSATWGKLHEDASVLYMGESGSYPVVSPIHFIAMKLHAAGQIDRGPDSLKDIGDIVETMREQSISLTDLKESGILEKHGKEDVISELTKRLGKG